MSKVEIKEVEKDDDRQAFLAHLSTIYNLANHVGLEGFLYINLKFKALVTNLQSMILCSIHGEKEAYYKIRETIQNGMKDFLEEHDKFIEEKYKEKIKDKH